MLKSSARATPKPCNEEGRSATERPANIFINHQPQQRTSTGSQSQHRSLPRDVLMVPKGAAVDLLRMAALTFSNNDLLGAQRFYEKMMLARSAWLAAHNKRLPDPDWLDRQRYGKPHERKAVARA